MLYDRKTGEKKNLTEDFDRWVGTVAWAPNSKDIFFTAENVGSSLIYELNLDHETWTRPIVGGFNDDISLTPDGKALVLTRMSISSPVEIYTAATEFTVCEVYWKDQKVPSPRYEVPECQLSKAQPLTHLNDAVLFPSRHVPVRIFLVQRRSQRQGRRFPGQAAELRRQQEISREVPHPRRAAGRLGRRLELSLESRTLRVTNFINTSGYVVIMINFHGSTGYGQKFIDAINGDWGGAPFEDLMKGLDYAEEHFAFIDKDRECALGASYGGYMANWVLGHTDRFKCIVTHDGMFNAESAWGTTEELWFNDWEFKGTPYDNRAMYEKWSPSTYAKNFKTPTLVIHGQKDYRLDVSQGFDLFTTLQMEGVPSEMLYFPDEGHWVQKPQNSQLWYKTVNDWVDRWTKK